jgi:hypothetical protein
MLTSIELQRLNLNDTLNSFSSNFIMNVPNSSFSDINQKEQFINDVDYSLIGSNGNKYIVVFNNSKDDKITVEQIPANIDADKYEALKKSISTTIFSSKKITSPELFGIQRENQGFSSTEYEQVFNIFNNTIVKSKQKEILDEFNKMLNIFYKDIKFDIIPYSLNLKNNI